MSTAPISRRSFLTGAVFITSILTLSAKPRSVEAAGESLPHLSDTDPMAKALHYTPHAARLNPATTPTYKAGDRCSKCRFFQGKLNESTGFAGCQIYPGHSVSAQGWCASYNAAA